MLRSGDNVQNFVIVSPLGEGGMGQVYLARDTRLNRHVALKLLHASTDAPDGSKDSERRSDGAARLLREAQAAAALEHPNVVTIYEVGEVMEDGEKCPFIAMELVKGRSLRAYCGDATVSVDTRVRWLVDVARALAAAHKASLVHRDIKPENVMIREDGVVKVLDFGLAKRTARTSHSTTSSTEAQVLPSITAKGIAIGTPYYMAPEQMRNEALDGRADQFAWAVMAYELLSGSPTWGKDIDSLELVSKVLSDQPVPLADVSRDVPRSVSDIVARAMSKKRADRFASTDDLVAALLGVSSPPAHDPLAVTQPQEPAKDAPPTPTPKELVVPDARASEAREPEQARDAAPPRRSALRRYAPLLAVAALAVAGLLTLGVRAVSSRAGAAGSSSSGLAPRECTSSSACVKKLGGKPAVCNPKGHCLRVESDLCTAHFEPSDLERDDTVWIGAMLPIRGPAGPDFGRIDANAVELARRDFATAMGSYQPGPGSPPAPRIAAVVCDDGVSYQAQAHHLVYDLGVPAVIGFGGTPETLDLASSLFVPNDFLTLVSISLSPLITSVPHGPRQSRLVYRTTYSTAYTARAAAAMVSRLESELRASRGLGTAPLRVAVVREKDRSAAAIGEVLFRSLHFNGTSALLNGASYLELANEGPSTMDETARRAAAFAPHVVVAQLDTVVPQVEAAWPRGAKDRPVYVLNTALGSEVLAFASASADRRRRIFGLSTVATTTANARLVVHYNETFAEPIARTLAPNTTYDAFYVAAYAAYATASSSPDRGLAGGVARLLPPGVPVDVGPSGIATAYAALAKGNNVDLNGTAGPLDFDLTTGEAAVDIAVLCASMDSGESVSQNEESGLVYLAQTSRLEGTNRCR